MVSIRPCPSPSNSCALYCPPCAAAGSRRRTSPPPSHGDTPIASGKNRPSRAGPFATAAPRLAQLDLVPIPCGGNDGKRPLLAGWQKLTAAGLHRQLSDLIARFGGENIGIACGASGIVVVDIDDPALIEVIRNRFGETPLVIDTPSGGQHLYYAANESIRNWNLRSIEGLAVDIRAVGGLVIAPPSVNPLVGASYQFRHGDWRSIRNLPPIRTETLPDHAAPVGHSRNQSGSERGRIPVGARNTWLFNELLKHAPFCDTFAALLDVAITRNDFLFEAPLPAAEVTDVAQRVWQYEIKGRNWVGKQPRILLTREEIHVFARHKRGGDALILWAELAGQHARNTSAFAIDTAAMARAEVLPGWSRWRYRQAKQALEDLGLLELMEIGHRRTNRTFAPNKYLLHGSVAGSRLNATGTASQGGGQVNEFYDGGDGEPSEGS